MLTGTFLLVLLSAGEPVIVTGVEQSYTECVAEGKKRFGDKERWVCAPIVTETEEEYQVRFQGKRI